MPELTTGRFDEFVQQVHGKDRKPFPWQTELLDHVLTHHSWPRAVDAPTGLGKTSVLDIATYAIAAGFPARRLFFVVDRRIVVDEAFEHATRLLEQINSAKSGVLRDVQRALAARAPGAPAPGLTVTRMRGGATWDWRWLDRADRLGICVGTVDQVGSRMFFRAYGLSNRLAPIDAALVGTDSILFVDEAHLAQPMISTIDAAQRFDNPERAVGRPTVVVQLSATQAEKEAVTLPFNEPAHLKVTEAEKRLRAAKKLHTVETTERASAGVLAAAATAAIGEHEHALVGVVVNTVAKARSVYDRLQTAKVPAILLTGRQRPWDRDQLLKKYRSRITVGWREDKDVTGPLILVATQCIEVGANLDLTSLITESAPWDSLVQRIGRVNRIGHNQLDEHILVVHAEGTNADFVYGPPRTATWKWLCIMSAPRTWKTDGAVDYPAITAEPGLGVSPLELRHLTGPSDGVVRPERPPELFRQHLHGWARTSPIPVPDAPIAPFLHGFDESRAMVRVLWRGDLPELTGDKTDTKKWRNAMLAMPPRADEELELPLSAVRAWLTNTDPPPLADVELSDEAPVVSASAPKLALRIDPNASMTIVRDPRELQPEDRVVVPCHYGGIDEFGWAPKSNRPALDIADVTAHRRTTVRLRAATLVPLMRRLGGDGVASDMEEKLAELTDELSKITLDGFPRKFGRKSAKDGGARTLLWQIIELYHQHSKTQCADRYRVLVRPVLEDTPLDALMVTSHSGAGGNDTPTGSSAGEKAQSLREHQEQVAELATVLARSLDLPGYLQRSVHLAACTHDLGKLDRRFQTILFAGAAHEADSALRNGEARAKSGIDPSDRPAFRNALRAAGYPPRGRHEALSAALTRHQLDTDQPDVDADLVLHLVAAHHGHSRPLLPHVPDPNQPTEITLPGASAPTPLPEHYGIDWTGPARFDRLRDRYGVWGLALLETILRQADIACSAGEYPPTEKPPNRAPERSASSPYRKLGDSTRGDARTLPIPALDGRVPLGFLATLGLHHLVTEHLDPAASLSWEPIRCIPSITTIGPSTLDELAGWLIELATGQAEDVQQPGWPPGFPPPGAAPDRLVPRREDFPGLLEKHHDARELVGALVTDLAVNNEGRVRRTPMVAPTGKQSFATMLANQDRNIRANPELLRQALTRWRRVGGTTAEGFDNQAIIGGADDDGKPGERAVPGAVWLAIASLPRYRLAADNYGRTTATAWRRINRRSLLVWPLWTPELDTHAVQALLEHPRVTVGGTGGDLEADLHELAPLGVTRVCAAGRASTGNSDGPLTPIPVTPTQPRAIQRPA